MCRLQSGRTCNGSSMGNPAPSAHLRLRQSCQSSGTFPRWSPRLPWPRHTHTIDHRLQSIPCVEAAAGRRFAFAAAFALPPPYRSSEVPLEAVASLIRARAWQRSSAFTCRRRDDRKIARNSTKQCCRIASLCRAEFPGRLSTQPARPDRRRFEKYLCRAPGPVPGFQAWTE